MAYNLLLIGCGNMAGAMLAGWLDTGLVNSAIVVKPTPLVMDHPAVSWLPPEEGLPTGFAPDMIVLGVKPQILDQVLPIYRHYGGQAPYLSLAAGKTLAYFELALGSYAAVIRTMPNLPSTIRQGVTGCVANDHVTEEQRATATNLLQAVGAVHWVAENQMNALTALSGSGPAYVFLLEEVLAQVGEQLGLSSELASSLARQTIIGTAGLLAQSHESAAIMRARVTSKAGVTEAAVNILLNDNALPELFAAALTANVRRAGELA